MDVNMPEMNGFTAIEVFRKTESTKRIPIIITHADSLSDRLEGISRGANDYMVKPCNPVELSLRIRNNLKIKEYQDFLHAYSQILEKCVNERTIRLNLALDELQNANRKIKARTIETICGEAIPLEARIVHIADVYDAIRSKRPYKPPMDHETALRIILTGDNRTNPEHFDALILEAFRDNQKIFREIFASFQE